MKQKKIKGGVKLTDTQLNFIRFAKKNNGFGIAAHGTGTGKTLAGIAANLELKNAGKIKKTLVVTPAALQTNFIDNVTQYTNAKAATPETATGNEDYIVTSYAKLRKNPGIVKAVGADAIIADELHRAKSVSTLTSKTIRRAAKNVKSFIGLTATPAQNTIEEAVNLHNIVSRSPIKMGDFGRRYVKRKHDSLWSWLKSAVTGSPGKGDIKGFYRQRELAAKFKKAFHFAPEMTNDKPKVKETMVRVPMSRLQTVAYRKALKKDLSSKEIDLLNKKNLPMEQAAKIVNRAIAARQVSNDPGYISGKSIPEFSTKTTKLVDDAMRHLAKSPTNKVVVFSNFKRHGTGAVSKLLNRLGVPHSKFQGGMPRKTRDIEVGKYKSGINRIMTITGAGAEGLNLPNTTMISLLDGHYNPSRIKQVEGRGVRRGGLKHLPVGERIVNINKYIAVPAANYKPVDERVYEIAKHKQDIIDSLWSAVNKPKFSPTPRQTALAGAGVAAATALVAPTILRKAKKWLSGSSKVKSVLSKIPKMLKFAAGNKYDFRDSGIQAISRVKDKEWPAVIQRHASRHNHFDLRLWDPRGNAGHSWATSVKTWPYKKGQSTIVARQPSHPLGYFGFTGVIPRGYGAGRVKREFMGKAVIEKSDPDKVVFTLKGENAGRMGGRFALVKQKDKKWRLVNVSRGSSNGN